MAMRHLLLQQALNHLIRQQALDIGALEGSTIRFVLQDLPFADLEIHFTCLNQRFFVQSASQQTANIDVKLKPDTLLALSQGADLTDLLKQDKISIHGEVKTAQLLVDLLQQIDPDLEEIVSHYTGDIVAHQAGKLWKTAQQALDLSNGLDASANTMKNKLTKLLIKPSVHP